LTDSLDDQFRSELAFYHSEHAGSSDAGYATYIIGGEPRISYLDSVRDVDKMAIDDEDMDEGSEYVPETKITLVNETDLESAISFFAPASIVPKGLSDYLLASKEQYARIHFVHIYSLSPSPVHVSIIFPLPSPASRKAAFRNRPSCASPRRVFEMRERVSAPALPLR
jgi:DNA polymerase delta subunit 3